LVLTLDKNREALRVSDPVVIHPELASETNSTHSKAAFTKRRRFHNPPGSPQATGNLKDFWSYVFRQAFRPLPKDWPQQHIVPTEIAQQQLETAGDHSITWLGHAAFVLQLGGRRIVLDPFLANRASPLSFAGPRRFIPAPLGITDLGHIDTLVISHNHYDHLCWHTLKHLPNRETVEVICPTGLAPWFTKRGFKNVTELGWHHASYAGDIKVTALPAIHHSRRGLFDANTSLWAAFLFEYQGFKVYFGGDSAMGPVFRQTGHKYGPIDLALIGIGAYAPRKLLRSVHASPEEAVEMGKAIGANALLGMHWGTIELSEEEAFEPARRFTEAALKAGYDEQTILLPSIGETVALDVHERIFELEATGT
jgi:N-acyl-phosphatidylethanolamine-hydrolysing phospholipase D